MENSTSTQATLEAPQKASRKATILSLAGSIVINVVLPILIYQALKSYTTASDFLALVLSGVPSMIDSVVGIIRKKRVDLLAGLTLASIVISLILIALGSTPKVYLIRESFFTVAFGLACLVSLLFPRPLMFYFGRHFATGNQPQNIAWFDSLWQYSTFRTLQRTLTVGWGSGFLLEAAIRIFMVLTLSTAQFLLISPFVIYGIIGILIAWTFLYSQRVRKRGAERLQRTAAEQPAPVPPNAS
ncbi:MAG: hypothetical protein M3Y81_09515 [Chloroflexota bacterium]|nr:hypothetical protein [Chloroflexota bacterium]